MNPGKPESPPRAAPQKVSELRVPMARTVRKRIAVMAIEQNTTAGKLALRLILAGLDAIDREKAK